MIKTQIYFSPKTLKELHLLSKKMKKSVAALVREAVQIAFLNDNSEMKGPVAIWDGKARRVSSDHDSIYDEQ